MKWLFFGLIVILLSSCDGIERFSGIVLDKDTKQPLAGVALIEVRNPRYSTESDSSGKFGIQYLVIRPSNEKFIVYKHGYESIKKELTVGGWDTVYISKREINPYIHF